jgi:RNA polymerase sigma-70 factor (ECF subfamily)
MGDLQLAEDTLAHAFEQALATWPTNGVPDNPEGWLLTVARNRQRDVWKSADRRRWVPLEAVVGTSADAGRALEDLEVDAIPDRRLALLFVCGHPAIAGNVRTPLMLQTVLGFDSAQIARAFAMPAAAMQQRLVRAKRRVRQAHIPFEVPGRSVMAERLPAVLEAVYGCYALTTPGGEQAESLSAEARYLAITIASMLEDEPEAWSLAALLTLATARGRSADAFQPLEEQDPATWDLNLILEGEGYLRRAECPGRAPGRFQLEAAIQAVHCDRVHGTGTNWPALSTLYAALVAIAPSLGSRVAQGAVVARTESPAAALRLLDALPPERERFQPYHATRADVLARAGHDAEAADAYRTAANLTEDPATARFLWGRADALDPERSNI